MNKNSCFSLLLVILVAAIGQIGAVSLKGDQEAAASANSTTTTTTAAPAAVETSRKYDLEHNPLRIGFEPFYTFANMFIDGTMHFNIPEKLVELFINMTQQERMRGAVNTNAIVNEIKTYYDIHDNLKLITSLPFKISTNFSILLIVSILFVIVVPIAGLFLCMCRLCVRSKFNPYDRKSDSAKRKILATILFGCMVLLLLSTVILFFTNQNANNAVQKSPAMIRSSLLKIKNLATEETPNYLEELIQNLEHAKTDSTALVKNFTLKINEDIKKNIFSDITQILQETKDLVNSSALVLSDINSEAESFNKVFARFRTEILKTSSPEIKNEINKMAANFKVDLKVNASEAQQVLSQIMQKPEETLTAILKALNDNIDSKEIEEAIDDKISTIEAFVLKLRSNETLNQIENGQAFALTVKDTAHAYEHLYYALMGVCVFMLLWFILYTMGLAGLCARRANDTDSQIFHRGVSANFLMTGTSFFFIFASILMAICIALYTPGILMRQYIAKPLMNPDANPGIKAAILPSLENTNLTSFFSQCRQNKPILSITEADEFFKEVTQVDIANLTSSNLIKPFIEKKREQLKLNLQPFSIESSEVDKVIDNLMSTFGAIKADSLLSKAESLKTSIDDLSALAIDSIKDGDALKKVWEEFNPRMDSLIEKLRGLKGWQKSKNSEISQLKNKIDAMVGQYNNQKEFNRLFTKTVNKTLEEEVLPNLNSVLSDILIIKRSPSCAPVALVYDDLVTSFCFEFLDNFNTYWFFLLLSLGLHMLVLGFAIALADLLRKFYAYDEVLTEDIVMDDAKPYDGYSDHHLKEGYHAGKTSSYH